MSGITSYVCFENDCEFNVFILCTYLAVEAVCGVVITTK